MDSSNVHDSVFEKAPQKHYHSFQEKLFHNLVTDLWTVKHESD